MRVFCDFRPLVPARPGPRNRSLRGMSAPLSHYCAGRPIAIRWIQVVAERGRDRDMNQRLLGFSASLILLLLSTICMAGEGSSPSCFTILLDTGLASAEERTLVCEGAAKARAFFSSLGIGLKRRIRLHLHEAGIEGRRSHLGSYDTESDQVDLLTLEQARLLTEDDALFGLQMDEPLYESLVVHEVAHAIAGQQFGFRPVPLVSQEYIAYVAQFSTMAPATRSRILRVYSAAAFAGLEEMSSTYYALNPSRFGVKAWLHYLSLSDRERFIRDLLSGAIRPVTEDPEW